MSCTASKYEPGIFGLNEAFTTTNCLKERNKPDPQVIKLLSGSTQLSMKFQLLRKLKYRQMQMLHALSLSDVVFIMLINVKMPTIVGNCWHFHIYEQDKIHAQLSLGR